MHIKINITIIHTLINFEKVLERHIKIQNMTEQQYAKVETAIPTKPHPPITSLLSACSHSLTTTNSDYLMWCKVSFQQSNIFM
jgi:hypothetical protein